MHVHIVDQLHVVIDPCDGTCRGQHNITIMGVPDGPKIHAVMLSQAMAFKRVSWIPELMEALRRAESIGTQMERENGYRQEEDLTRG